MQAIVYYLTLPFIYLISLLPFPLLYLFSDFVFFLLFHVIGYRKDVVLQNLRNSFPQKTEAELLSLRKAYFHYMCDLSLETLKVLTMSRETMMKHCILLPQTKALFDKYAAEGKSVLMVLGHLGNWEWAGHPFSLQCKQRLDVVYHPLTNKYFDRLMFRMRSRFGTKMIPMQRVFREMATHKNDLTCTVFVSDQTPQPDNAYWTTFLNQDTPVFKGTEVIAKKMNLPIIYARVHKVKRGYYDLYAETLVENPAATADGEISELHTRRLEQDIIAYPETWLWSHRRWKHKKPKA